MRIRIGRRRTDGTDGRAACARNGSNSIAPCVCPAAVIRLSISAGSAIGKWAKGAPSPLPTTRAACSHPNSQQRTRACLSEPFDCLRAPSTCVCARHCVRRWRGGVRHLPPPLRAGPAAAAARTTRRECRITAVSRRRLRVRLRVGFALWGGGGGDPIGCGANKHPRVIVPRPTTARTVLSS